MKLDDSVRWHGPKNCSMDACPEVAFTDGMVYIRSSASPEHIAEFSVQEWKDFVEGVKLGDFEGV